MTFHLRLPGPHYPPEFKDLEGVTMLDAYGARYHLDSHNDPLCEYCHMAGHLLKLLTDYAEYAMKESA